MEPVFAQFNNEAEIMTLYAGKPVGIETVELTEDDPRVMVFRSRMFRQEIVAFQPLTPMQFKLGMLYLNLVPDQIDVAIAALAEPDRTIAKIYWTSTQVFKRDDPILIAIASTFGITSIQLDEAWKYAEKLV
ncbi:hypothetical protein CPT_Palo_050 [Rhizobium phage Palo]|uniref:Uncharacterized protein n=1 Tax=Rhizobium phage Palo TaxID=2767573 RepID=A0A7L8G641_9CAUD|nr:hypothetical protein CPT_Palo_050 [Rhizobium phage Palo]